MYSQADKLPNYSSQTKQLHKEGGNKRPKLDFDDRETISSDLAMHSHPLTVQSELLYNIVNGQVAPADVNVLLIIWVSSLRVTCLYHDNRFCVIFISVVLRCSSCLRSAQHSVPYILRHRRSDHCLYHRDT